MRIITIGDVGGVGGVAIIYEVLRKHVSCPPLQLSTAGRKHGVERIVSAAAVAAAGLNQWRDDRWTPPSSRKKQSTAVTATCRNCLSNARRIPLASINANAALQWCRKSHMYTIPPFLSFVCDARKQNRRTNSGFTAWRLWRFPFRTQAPPEYRSARSTTLLRGVPRREAFW